MLKVTILSANLRKQPYTNKKGLPAELLFQTAYLFTVGPDGKPGPFPEKVEAFCRRDEAGKADPYPAGDYVLAPDAISIRDGRIECALRLAPFPHPGK